jgi:uncharacterized membrane protein
MGDRCIGVFECRRVACYGVLRPGCRASVFPLHWNNRAGRAYESIDLTEDTLTIDKIDPWGHHQSWSFQLYLLRVELAKMDQGRNQLALKSHGKSITIGAFLTNGACLSG